MKTKAELQAEITQHRSAVLIVNTFSRHGERLFFRTLDGLTARGIHITASYPVRHPRQLLEIAQEALSRKPPLVIVGGGDGTLSTLTDYFAYQDVVMGVLPLGTGNSFARGLGLPLELGAAMDVIVQGKVVDVDLGKINENYFANNITIGFSAEVAHHIPNRLKRIFGPLAYGIQAMKHILTSQKFHLTLTTDHETYTTDSYQVIIANGSGFGLAPIIPGAHADDRKLTILALEAVNRWQLLSFWGRSLFGTHRPMQRIKMLNTEKVTVHTDPPKPLDIDGEEGTQTPVTITLAPNALKIIAPQTFKDF
ncbi:MAG: YegS/Rv2252/BmrU family lipid kinase [Anaerolineales bacterium]